MRAITKGTTGWTDYVFVQDAASTTGGGKTGLTYDSAGLTAYYVRPRNAAVAIALATQTVTGAWASGGFVEVDAVHAPGLYRLDLPDAALAVGADAVVVYLHGASGMAPLVLRIALIGMDFSNATTGGLANLDAAVSSRLADTNYTAPDNTSVTAIKAKTDNLPTSPAAVGDIPTAIENADALLKRDWTAVTGEAARSALNALRILRNKWSTSGGTLTVTKEDDSTSAWTSALSSSASADPITGSDPS
jgi:hypothetical protein